MTNLFTQAMTAFQSLLSRAFWFGAFLPVAVFALLNGLLWLAIPGLQWPGDAWAKLNGDKLTWAPLIALGLVVFAYMLAPLVPLFRQVLDGRRLPDWLYDRLRANQLRRQQQAFDNLSRLNNFVELVNSLTEQVRNALRPQSRGASGTEAEQPQDTDASAADLQAMIARLDEQSHRGTRPSAAALRRPVSLLQTLARQGQPGLRPLALALIQVLGRINESQKDPRDRAAERYNAIPAIVQATEIGNARRMSQAYVEAVYRADFTFLWNRVQMVIPESDPIAKQIEAARALIDFAVLLLLLWSLSLLVWLPLLGLFATNAWAFLAVAAFGPIGVRLLYQLVVQSQLSLGETAQGAVDRFRFDVLKAMRIAPPATLAAERELWSRLSSMARREAPNLDIVWKHPA